MVTIEIDDKSELAKAFIKIAKSMPFVKIKERNIKVSTKSLKQMVSEIEPVENTLSENEILNLVKETRKERNASKK